MLIVTCTKVCSIGLRGYVTFSWGFSIKHEVRHDLIMSPTEGEGDRLFLMRILLASALASVVASASV